MREGRKKRGGREGGQGEREGERSDNNTCGEENYNRVR